MTQIQEPQEVDVSDKVIEASNAHGEVLFSELTEQFDEMLDDGLDPIAVVFHLWISFIYVLAEAGWTMEDLLKEVKYHRANSDMDVEGHA